MVTISDSPPHREGTNLGQFRSISQGHRGRVHNDVHLMICTVKDTHSAGHVSEGRANSAPQGLVVLCMFIVEGPETPPRETCWPSKAEFITHAAVEGTA